MDKERLKQLVREHALELAPEGEFFTLKSGAKSKYYLDCRNLHLTPLGLQAVVLSLWDEMNDMKIDAFGGPSIGADPIVGGLTFLVAMTTMSTKWHGFLIRKEGKDHGKGGRIVGPLKPDARCVIIEDVVTSGSSSLDAIEAVESFGAKVVHVFSVVDRLAGGAELFASKGYPYKSLLTIKDFGLE